MLILADTIVTLDSADRIHQPGYLRIEDGVLREVGPGRPQGSSREANVIELNRRLIMPGLVNAHTHSPMVLFRGLAEGHSLLTLAGWQNAIRTWEEILDPDWIAAAVTVSCAEMIRTGTTTFADQYFFMDKIVPIVDQSGMRAALAYGIVELGDPAARQNELDAAQGFLESVADSRLIDGWLGPHAFFVDNSPAAIKRELELADRYGAGLHIHFSTSGEEDRYCLDHFGIRAVSKMDRMGILDHRILAAHCLTVPYEDMPHLADSSFSAVLCPSAAMRSGASAPKTTLMQNVGIQLAVGTDNVANNNSYDLFEEMRTLAKLASFKDSQPAALSAADAVRMATQGGARALGLGDQIGTLEPGKQADLIALDLSEIGWAPRVGQDICSALTYAVAGMHVTDTMVAGRWLYRDREWLTLDYDQAVADLDRAHEQMVRARNKEGVHAPTGD